jgi:hypothetical protein
VVRIFNPTTRQITGSLVCWKKVKKAWLTNMNEERRDDLTPQGATIPLKVGKKKIVTIEFEI